MVEFAINLFAQFFVMRVVVHQLGISALGIWSLLMSAAQMAKLLDPGASAGAGRFLSLAEVESNVTDIEKILASIFYATFPLYLGLSVVIYLPLKELLGFVMHGDALILGKGLLVFAIGSYIFQTFANIYSSALISLHLGSFKSKICIVGSFLQAGLGLALVGKYGLYGLAVAQILSYLFIAVFSLAALKVAIGISLGRLLITDWRTLRRITSFGLRIQLASMAWTGFEMSIRFSMSHFGGLGQMGYYEIASKFSSQARILASYICQPLAPALVAFNAKGKNELKEFYRRVYARIGFFAFFSAAAIIVLSPLTGLVMLGTINMDYVLFSVLTALGTAAHITAIPSELTAISTGTMRYNLAGSTLSLGAMIVLGPLLGYFLHARGVALAVLICSLVGASIPIVFNSRVLALPIFPNIRRHLHVGELLRPWRRA